MEREQNLCHQVGCPDLCCKDMWLHGVDDNELGRVFPDAERVGYGDLGEIPFSGVYYTPNGNGNLVRLEGRCPHNNAQGCDINEEKIYGCKSLDFGGGICKSLRGEG